MTTNEPEVWAIIDKHCATGVILIRHGHEKLVDGDRMIRISDYEALQAECEKLRKDAERYVPLHEAVQRAAGELPAGWVIQLCVERHSGWVELIGPDGTEDFDTNNERLDYTVIDGLEAAMQGGKA